MEPEQRKQPEPQPYSPQPYRPEPPGYRAPPQQPPQPPRETSEISPELLRQVTSLSDVGRNQIDRYVIQPPPPKPVSLPERAADHTLAAVAHFAIAFGFVGIGFLLSIVINIVLWLYSKRSPLVRFHAGQAGAYQVFVLLFNAVYLVFCAVLFASPVAWGWNPILSALAILLLVPFAVWFVLSIIYGVWGGFRVLAGKDFRYPFFGRDTKRN